MSRESYTWCYLYEFDDISLSCRHYTVCDDIVVVGGTITAMDKFRVRLNCIDHYQAIPTRYDPVLRNDGGQDRKTKDFRLPVIRVFGSTETGQKVCAHIHGAFPYLYVEYTGSLEPDEGLSRQGLNEIIRDAY